MSELVVGAALVILAAVLLLFGGSNSEVQGDNGTQKEQGYALVVEAILAFAGAFMLWLALKP